MRWVHLETERAESLKWLLEHTDVDPTIAEALVAGDTRPRAIPDEEGLLLVLRNLMEEEKHLLHLKFYP